jgi:hypothetical protein
MNIRVLLSALGIAVALFIGGAMAYINNAHAWAYVLWGLDIAFILILSIYYFITRRKSNKNTDNWIIAYKSRNGKLPPIPVYLEDVIQKNTKGSPISKDIELIPMSGQFWNNLLPSQRDELKQLVEWLGMSWDDYYEQMKRMLPKENPKQVKINPFLGRK